MSAKAALYQRVSTSDGKQSLQSQTHKLKAFAKSQGWKSKPGGKEIGYEWFSDFASGAPGCPRKGLASLLRACSDGKVQIVVVTRLDRLSRSVRDGLTILQTLTESGVRVIATDQNLDFNGAMGQFLSTLFLALAEWERGLIRERVKAGLDAARARGTRLGRPVNLERRNQIRALFDSGVPAREIGARLGIKRAAVYASLKKTA